jgi:hypothetical protein
MRLGRFSIGSFRSFAITVYDGQENSEFHLRRDQGVPVRARFYLVRHQLLSFCSSPAHARGLATCGTHMATSACSSLGVLVFFCWVLSLGMLRGFVRFSGLVTMPRSLIRIGRIRRCCNTSSPWSFPFLCFFPFCIRRRWCLVPSLRSGLPKPARGCATALRKTYLAKIVYCWHMLVIPSLHASPCVSCTGYWGMIICCLRSLQSVYSYNLTPTWQNSKISLHDITNCTP